MLNTIVSRIKENKFTLIAEVGVNYYDIARDQGISPMEAAKLMCLKAKEAGIHAVKFQTYKAETLAAHESPSYWDLSEEPTTNQRELFKKFDSFGQKEYKELADYCESIEIEFLSTAFDYKSADYLDEMMNVYKISSSDLTNIPFIEHQAKKGKPVMLSIGASNEDEIETALAAIRRNNSEPIILLHCVLEYPTPYAHANLAKIRTLCEKYSDVIVGYSDHTKPDGTCDVQKTAVALGARVIEKHYTLNKTLTGNDHYHAMDPEDARDIIEAAEKIEELMGNPALTCLETESAARANARRSIVSACVIPAGTVITEEMLTAKRPGTGISPVETPNLIGKVAATDIGEDEIMKWEWME
ncbi:MAG: N-acetylneuraminate synthase family protein [Pseudobutyrivibrio sp.]|nr:N-acetylneuraminate synthase family protein [Pseudobutyrivibrio sp.]MCF0184976.1 N-acetylneuraminate synthase family protein [Bacteroidaceae bacterium]